MRGALSLLLGLEADIEVVAEVGRGDEVVPPRSSAAPDVALLDIEMPGRSGLDAAAELRRRCPACRVLILTTFGRPGYLRRAMEAGAAGFLVKDGPVEELADGDPPGAGGWAGDRPRAGRGRAERRRQPADRRASAMCWRAAVDGATVADIAARVHLSESTVRNYLSVGHRQDRDPQPHGGRPRAPGTAGSSGRLLRRHARHGYVTSGSRRCHIGAALQDAVLGALVHRVGVPHQERVAVHRGGGPAGRVGGQVVTLRGALLRRT